MNISSGITCLLALLFLLCSACSQSAAQKTTRSNTQADANANAPINVKVEQTSGQIFTEEVLAHGVTKAIHLVTHSAEISGKIDSLAKDVGDRVKKGQMLARIDYKTVAAQAKQAEANYGLAKATYERVKALREEALTSEQQMDEARSNLLSAEAQLEITQATLEKSMVRATHNGIVGAKFVEQGEYVAPGAPMFFVVDLSTIIVEAELAETQVATVERGAPVEIHISALNKTFAGNVHVVIPAADEVAKTFPVRVHLENPTFEILVGMSATLRIKTRTQENVVMASQSAVLSEENLASVFVAKDGIANKRLVTLGPVQGDRVVLASGVQPGEQLIVVGQRNLVDGQRIRVVQ